MIVLKKKSGRATVIMRWNRIKTGQHMSLQSTFPQEIPEQTREIGEVILAKNLNSFFVSIYRLLGGLIRFSTESSLPSAFLHPKTRQIN